MFVWVFFVDKMNMADTLQTGKPCGLCNLDKWFKMCFIYVYVLGGGLLKKKKKAVSEYVYHPVDLFICFRSFLL